MTEKVIFEFRTLKEKNGMKYQIQRGDETFIYSGLPIFGCIPNRLFPLLNGLPRMHRKFIQRSQKRVQKILGALENMYADIYANEDSVHENRNDEEIQS